jgi:hypothetical protein
MQKAQKRFETNHQRKALDEDLHGLAQHFSFPVPNLPGDKSLIEDFLADLGVLLRKESKLISSNLHYLYIGPILFHLVILREYLHKLPNNDHVIFQLVQQNRVHRIWTSHKQALAACHGEEDSSSTSPLRYAPSPLLYRLSVINDTDIIISNDEILVAIQSPEAVDWTSGTALSGGPRKPRRYTPPYIQPTVPPPRPKRQLVDKKVVHFENRPAGTGSGPGRIMGSEQDIGEGVYIAGNLLKDCQSVNRIPLGTVVDNGEGHTVLRWRKRAQKS